MINFSENSGAITPAAIQATAIFPSISADIFFCPTDNFLTLIIQKRIALHKVRVVRIALNQLIAVLLGNFL